MESFESQPRHQPSIEEEVFGGWSYDDVITYYEQYTNMCAERFRSGQSHWWMRAKFKSEAGYYINYFIDKKRVGYIDVEFSVGVHVYHGSDKLNQEPLMTIAEAVSLLKNIVSGDFCAE